MKIAFNPSTVAALTTPPNNKDITFDLRGQNIFARGVKFCGTDTDTWRDIKINNVSIGSNILDLRNGSNTTLTNINGVVTINSTWRPVVDNLTSDSTTSSLSAKQGKVLKALIDGKSNLDHNHDGRYLRLSGQDTMQGNLYLHSHGTSYIGKGLGDKSGADFTEANIVIRSWWGISFKSYDDIVRTYIDTRTGNIGTKGVLNAVGAVIQGRVYNGGDDEGIIINPAPNGYAGLILGTHNGERSVFYLKKGNPFWRYNNGSTNLDIQHPKKPGVIALTSDIPSKDSWNYDDRYLKLTGGRMSGDINFGGDNKIHWGRNTDSASISFKNDGDGDANSYMSFVTSDNGNEYFRWSHSSGSTNTEWMALRGNGLRVRGTKVSLEGHTHDDRYYTKAESNAKYITDIATSVNKLTFTRNGSNIIRDITVNVVHSQGRLTNIPNKDATTKASPGLLIYDSYAQTIGTNSYSSVLSINTGGTIQIAGDWGGDQTRNLYWRSQSDRNVADYPWKSWRTILDSENYSSTLDSRYYTESEVNSLLDAKLNRQNLSYGNWNPRGYHLAADYHYNGGDLSISESGGKIHVSVDGYFWQNEGQYRVLDTSDVAGLKSNLTVYQYLSATDAAWYPLVWGGNAHKNTSDSTGPIYKSYDKLCWQTSSQTLYATNIQTNNIKGLSIGGGIYWNPNVESASDNTDAASITLVRSGVAGGTTLVLSQMNDTNDTIQFKTNTAARLYHNSYPILTTQNTYVSNNKGYINGLEITQVNNADTLDGYHAASFVKMKQFRFSQYRNGFWTKILTITIKSTSDLQPVIAFNWIPSACARRVWAEFTINWRSNSPIFYAIWKGTAVRTLTCVNSFENIWNVWVQGDKNGYDPFGEVQVTYAYNISSYNGGSLGYSDLDPGGTRCTLGGHVNYARSTDNADTVDGQHASAFSYKSWWHWYGKDGQPNWLWGGNNENDYYVYNPSNFRVAYAASAGNADTLDGYHANGSNDRPYGHIPTIGSDGVMEVGRYIDFHNDNNGKHDYSTRLQSTGNYGNEVNLPSASGTLALINDVNNYYWANVKISTSSSTTTSPTVHTLTATRVCAGHNPGIDNSISCSNWFRSSGNTGWYNTTYYGGWYMSDTSWIRAHNGVGIYTSGQIYSSSSIRMSNILLEHTDEINNSTNGGIHLNCRNSGNVSLCYGGGNVGIGTTTPSYKLDVNGQMRASGFHHSSVNSDNYILLAGGGYKSFGGDYSTPIFLGCLDLYHGGDGTISSSFCCLGYSVPFTYTRGGNYCKIVIPDTTRLSFYIIAAIASVNYSGGGMDTWVGQHRGDGAWWLHCQVFGWNEVRVKGFRLANSHNDSWWGGNPLYSDNGGANEITVCIFGHVKYK